jgi:hypothetical protein
LAFIGTPPRILTVVVPQNVNPYGQKIETIAKSEGYAGRGVALRVAHRYPIRARPVPADTDITRCRPCALRLRRSEHSNRRLPSAQQFILQSARKPLRLNAPILGYFTAKSLYRITRNLTLNQRVQASSPCAPTNDIRAQTTPSKSKSAALVDRIESSPLLIPGTVCNAIAQMDANTSEERIAARRWLATRAFPGKVESGGIPKEARIGFKIPTGTRGPVMNGEAILR